MAITREDLLAYQEVKKKELQEAITNKTIALEEVEVKVKDFKAKLVADVEIKYSSISAGINAELSLLDDLLKKEAEQEKLL